MAETIKIGGELESTATGNVVAAASAIKDKVKNKYQGEINAETDISLADRYTKAETYNKTELNNMITTPNQGFVSVVATNQTTAATDVLPATGEADTIYRVGNWDGTQYNDSVFSEYAWNGSAYIKLSTKSQVGEVYDISANHADTKYADLSAALGTNGANIPQSLQKGGMSVKFVQSSDNKYVQCRLMSDEWSVNTEDWAIADEGVYVENPEFVYVKTDDEGKILWALKIDGDVYYGAGVPQQVIDYIEEKIADFSPDEYEDIVAFLNGLEKGDKTLQMLLNEKVDKEEGKSLIDSEYASTKSTIDNPEFLEVTTDSEGRLLAGRTPDGAAFENVKITTPKVLIGGATIESIEDLEGRSEITTDSEDKIISYRDKNGVKHEDAGIETNHLGLSEEGLTDLARDLKEHGVSGGQGDWSDSKELHIAEPYCARVNFTGIDNIPQSKGVNLHGYMQFWDMNGNYFKKEVIMNAQGNSTMGHPKKNIAIDICNNNGWDDDDTFKLQIGSWVYQDSFHLKAYYNDPFRGICAVGYKFFDKIVKSKGELYDYVWKRALIDLSSITTTSNGASTTEDTKNQYNTGARCFPDGFPCIVYLNGDFYGIYAFQLKKHRDNYCMDKKEAKHIHIDGNINNNSIFSANGDASLINWDATTDAGIEIRNPKNLYLMDGTKYDADNNAGELIDETSEYYDETNKDHKRCAKVKKYILDLSKVKGIIEEAKAIFDASEKTSSDILAFKEVFETYLDVDSLIEYTIFSDISNNYDGFSKNWQWITYDGVKWYIVPYDVDGIFGNFWELNDTIYPPLTNHVHKYTTWLFDSFYTLYTTDAENMYATLREKDIISADTIMNIVVNWLDRVGNKGMFDKEWEKWPDFIKNDSVHRLYKWVVQSIGNMDSLYNYNN